MVPMYLLWAPGIYYLATWTRKLPFLCLLRTPPLPNIVDKITLKASVLLGGTLFPWELEIRLFSLNDFAASSSMRWNSAAGFEISNMTSEP